MVPNRWRRTTMGWKWMVTRRSDRWKRVTMISKDQLRLSQIFRARINRNDNQIKLFWLLDDGINEKGDGSEMRTIERWLCVDVGVSRERARLRLTFQTDTIGSEESAGRPDPNKLHVMFQKYKNLFGIKFCQFYHYFFSMDKTDHFFC